MFSEFSTFEVTALDELHELQVEGEPSFVGSLINEYLTDLDASAALVISHQEAGLVKPLEESSHKLKSGSAVLGLKRLAAACAAIEQRARKGELAPAEVAAFKIIWPESKSALAEYVRTL